MLSVSFIDIILRLYVLAVHDEEGVLVTDVSQFRAMYTSSRAFILDMLATLPISFIAYASTGTWDSFSYMRFSLVFRLYSANEILSDLLTTLEFIRGRHIDANLLRVMKFVSFVWTYVHLVACMMCLVGIIALTNGTSNWIKENEFVGFPYIEIYLRGYFWSAYTIITVGYGSIAVSNNLERAIAMCSMTIGAIICNAGIAAVFSSIISNYDDSHGKARRYHEARIRFCKSNKVDSSIQRRLSSHYSYLSTELGFNDIADDLHLTPRPILHDFFHGKIAMALARVSLVQGLLDDAVSMKMEMNDPNENNKIGCISNNQMADVVNNKDASKANGSTKCPLAMRREGLLWSLARVAEVSLFVPGEVVLTPRDISEKAGRAI